MSDFQVSIVSAQPAGKAGKAGKDDADRFEVRPHGRRSGKVIASIDDLASIWDQVIEKLSAIADKSDIAASAGQYDLNSIEFSIGIEAGLSVGLVTKGQASVSITFTKKPAS